MKLKQIAAAAVLAAAAPAFAAISPPSGGNGELFFVVRDDVAQISYTLDLGVTLNDFYSLGQQAGGYAASWTIDSTDANFMSFLGQTDAANYQWAVQGGDSVGGATAGGVRWFTTAVAGTAVGTIDNMTNTQLTNGLGAANTFYGVVNASGTHASQPNGSSVNNILDAGQTYYGEPGGTGPTFNSQAPFSNLNAVGASSAFYHITRSGAVGLNPVTVDPFDNASGQGYFSLLSNGAGGYTLSYAIGTVAAVPEPGGIALLLAGLTAMGFVGRRRSGR
jgi:hypothetical protein